MNKAVSMVGTALGTLALLGIGLGIGSAVAGEPAVIKVVSKAVDRYELNGDGATFGVSGESSEPSLIGVYASNGKQGYVWNTELDKATGAPSQFASPEEALAWQAESGRENRSIPVYESDGKTVVGEFVIVGSDEQQIEISK